MKILSFGEVLWDIYPDKKFLGGAPLNFAAHLAKHGENVFMLSALGCDTLGDEAMAQLKKWGVETKYVARLEGKKTGSCQVTLDENSVPSYNLLADVAFDYIDCQRVLDSFEVLYFGTLALRSENNAASLKKLLDTHSFKEIFVDVNVRKPFCSEKSVRLALENASIVKVSREELDSVARFAQISEAASHADFAKAISQKFGNLKCVIVTLDENGAFALDCTANREFSASAVKTQLKSSVGAGDSFSAAFLHRYLKGDAMPSCLEYASRIAGYVVSQYDAVPEYNTKDFE